MRVLIVDDEEPARNQIREYLEGESDVDIVGESGDGSDALEKILALGPDLVFMDIQMPEMTGIEVLRSSTIKKWPYTVFTTAYGNYASDAFEVEAADYLLKPIDKHRFKAALQRVRRYRAKDITYGQRADAEILHKYLDGLRAAIEDRRSTGRISVKVGMRTRFLDTGSIELIQADGDYINICTVSGEQIHTREGIAIIEGRLPKDVFIRVHRSTIVNSHLIREIRSDKRGGDSITMLSGRIVKSGTKYQKSVKQLLGR